MKTTKSCTVTDFVSYKCFFLILRECLRHILSYCTCIGWEPFSSWFSVIHQSNQRLFLPVRPGIFSLTNTIKQKKWTLLTYSWERVILAYDSFKVSYFCICNLHVSIWIWVLLTFCIQCGQQKSFKKRESVSKHLCGGVFKYKNSHMVWFQGLGRHCQCHMRSISFYIKSKNKGCML